MPEGFDIDLAFSLDDRPLQGVLDSLNEQVAVLERSGKIVRVNRAWREIGGPVAEHIRFTGVNYPDVCRLAVDAGEQDALQSYEGIRGVLSGQASEFSLEYRSFSLTKRSMSWRVLTSPKKCLR